MAGNAIGSASGGENSSPAGTEKFPVSGSKYMLLSTIAEYIRTLTQTLTNKTLTTPTIASFVNATHTHRGAAAGGSLTQIRSGVVGNPNSWYTNIRAQIVMFRTDAAITITRIHIHGADTTPTSELAGDLKFADDVNTGGFANATVIDVCDTTSGVFTATSSFDDATVPSGKYVYFQMDSAPHADWKDFFIEVHFTYD